ncbi:UDP-N-acetylglucosamine-peptide N-acetylglucosaminyltransferase [Selenomonas sp. WCA-380-WT-3B 3/]|uniref:UDP-N-acetylglucosamine-peptide N-acetylglucosaminyltransferase n=1 Tax=Selenomonas montiformis TaxID=2652285 RepID=A0A6I2US24_9FIRM|nr:UDP-N-acetylglucosamine-peptide N-acetylglucosaminyltransferase [Selenomonas montiformis]MSV25003.1 UDP-N-acetylglucosamine-peptide N-acetylglucosaminyltransferase [Selenomonas montiformis]
MNLGDLDSRYGAVLDLLKQEAPQQALDRLNRLVQQEGYASDEEWRVLQYYSQCYYKLFDKQKCREYSWAALQHSEGQPFRIQQLEFSDYLFMLHYYPEVTDTEMRQMHFAYDQFTQAVGQYEHSLERHRHDKLRIGYIAGEFTDNVVSYFTIQLLLAYNREAFDVYCYQLHEGRDLLSDDIEQHIAVMRRYPRNAEYSQVAQAIYEDEIDILFDFDVHASGGRTMAVMCYRPAPVQAAGIGYMNTSGSSAVDYFLGDPYCDPPGMHDEDFREEIWRLPHSHFCYTPSARVLNVKKEYKLHEPILFGSFNNFLKINTAILEDWLQIIRQVPGSRILIKNSSHKTNALKIIGRQLNRIGFKPEEYILEDATGDYLARYLDVDILLDTYPYTGGGTTCEALYMGVPVIARYGRRHGERFSYGILQNIGLGDLACATREEYVAKAVALAGDKALLTALHQQIPVMMQHSPLMDGPAYVQAVEDMYRTIWAKWRQKQEAAGVTPNI